MVRKAYEIIFTPYIYQEDLNSDLYKTMTMLNMSRILESIDVEETVGGFLSLYALMNSSILEIEEYVSEITKESITLKKVEIRSKEDITKYFNYTDKESNEILLKHLKLVANNTQKEFLIYIRPMSKTFKEKFNSLNYKATSIVAYVGLCLVLLSKKLDRCNYESWKKTKWNSFLRVVGVNRASSEFGPSEVLFPRLKLCRDIYTFFKKHKSLRRTLFVGIMKLSTQDGIWGNICRAILKLTKGVEMNHICLINTYILQDHPEVILKPELKHELLQLQSAFKIFENSGLPKEQWPYLKILFFPLKDEFDKKHFPILTNIAIEIGMKTQPSLLHFTSLISPEKKAVADKILDIIYKEDSLSCYKRLKSKNKTTSKNIPEKKSENFNQFTELLNLSNSLEESLHQSLGVYSFHEKDLNVISFPNSLPTTKITFIKLSEKAETRVLSLVSLLSIAKVYDNGSIESVVGGILTLLVNFKFFVDDFKTVFLNHGYELQEILVESLPEVALYFEFEDKDMDVKLLNYCVLSNKPHSKQRQKITKISPEFKKYFHQDNKICISTILTFIGLCLTFIFKQLSDENCTTWVNHKINTFLRVLRTQFPNSSTYLLSSEKFFPTPTLETIQAIYCFFSTNFQLRKLILLRIWSITSSKHILNWTCLVVGQIAKATEMNHIFLINQFLIKENSSVLLKMKELRPELKRFLNALENLLNKATEEKYWPFLKIILHPADAEFFNKNNFPLLSFVAENYNNESKKYKGSKLSTSYMKQTTQITKEFYKTITDDNEKVTDIYFRLNLQIGDLLSTINDEQLKNLYIISELLSFSLKGTFCYVSEEKIEKIKKYSVDEAKESFAKRINPFVFDIEYLNRLIRELFR